MQIARVATHVAVVVLDRHGRIVDQDTHGKRQPAERHDVERLAHHVEHADGREDRQRDRCDDDEGAPPGAEEQQDHQSSEARGDRAFTNHAGDRSLDEDALIEQKVHAQALGHAGHDLRHQLANAAHDRQRRRVAAGQNR